jgi:hypothetical protein
MQALRFRSIALKILTIAVVLLDNNPVDTGADANASVS